MRVWTMRSSSFAIMVLQGRQHTTANRILLLFEVPLSNFGGSANIEFTGSIRLSTKSFIHHSTLSKADLGPVNY